MSAYGALAAWYDALTRDVDYAAFADFYEQCFQQGRGACRTLLDFCCGTGTLTRLMAARGYEMIATDGSPDMLMQAQMHNADLPAEAVPPLLLCQEASQLDLYGTVDAAYCSLDGFDYLPPEELAEVLTRRPRPCPTAGSCSRARASSGRAHRRSILSMRTRRSGSRSCSRRRAFWT